MFWIQALGPQNQRFHGAPIAGLGSANQLDILMIVACNFSKGIGHAGSSRSNVN
jgi:hypothetical protein